MISTDGEPSSLRETELVLALEELAPDLGCDLGSYFFHAPIMLWLLGSSSWPSLMYPDPAERRKYAEN